MKKLLISVWIILLSICTYSQNNALQFDGINQHVVTNKFYADMNPTNFSITMWVRVEVGAGTKRSLITSQYTNTTNQGYAFYVNTSNQWELWVGTGTGSQILTGPAAVTDKWTHIAGTYNGTTLVLYINGVEVANAAISNFVPNTTSLFYLAAGEDDGSDYYFNGKMDEVTVWKSAISQDKIRSFMYASAPTGDSDIETYYNMNKTSGNILNDNVEGSSWNKGLLQNMADDDWTPSAAWFGPGMALSFDGVDEYVDLNDGYINTSGIFTLEAWVYPTELNTGEYYPIFGNEEAFQASTSPPSVFLHGNNLYAGFGDGTAWYDIETEGGITLNEWNHVVARFNGTWFVLFVNGVQLISENEASGKTPSATPIQYLGKQGSNYFHGRMEDARIWSVSRNTNGIQYYMVSNPTAEITGFERYFNFDMGSGTTVQDYTTAYHDATMVNFDGDEWIPSDVYNTWLNTNSTDWNTAGNWSRGVVPISSDNVGISNNSTNQVVISSGTNVTNNIFFVQQNKTLTIDAGATLTTSFATFINGNIVNNGEHNIGGKFAQSNGLGNYSGSGTTKYNGSTTQVVEWENFHNLVMANSHDTIFSSTDSIFVAGDFTVETGEFATPTYMSVLGTWTMNTGTALHVLDISTVDVIGDFDSQTAIDLRVDGYGTVQSTITLNSNIIGNGTFFAQTYESGDFTVFGVLSPPEATFISAYNWDGEAGDNDWGNSENWSNGKEPGSGTDVTIDPGTPEGNYPSISDNEVCKSLTLNNNTKLFINNGGSLDVSMSVNLQNNSELNVSAGGLSTDNKNKGTFDATGAAINLISNGQLDIKNHLKLNNGSTFSIDASNFSVTTDLTIDASTVTLNNNSYGLIVGNTNVKPDSELKLLTGSHLDIGGASINKK